MTVPTSPGLRTLCYRLDPDQLGNLVLYPLTSEFDAAWEQTRRLARLRRDRQWDLSYASLATALTAATRQPVRLFPQRQLSADEVACGTHALLVTTQPIDPWILRTALTTFEQLSTDGASGAALASAVGPLPPTAAQLSEFVARDTGSGALSAPGWLYDTACWNFAGRIATAPVTIDGYLPISLRLDTEGNLLAWDALLSRSSTTKPALATIYVATRIVTLPGADALYLHLDAHVSRHPYTWSYVKNAWLDRGDSGLPILRLPVLAPYPQKGRREPQLAGFAGEIIESCGLDQLSLPTDPTSDPAHVRPIGKPRRHHIGKGPGVRFLYQIGQHASRQLGLDQLSYRKTAISVTTHITGPILSTKLDDAVKASRIDKLRIVCLYADADLRRRVINALAPYTDPASEKLTSSRDNDEVPLTSRLSVIFCRVPDVVNHGSHERLIDEIPWLSAPEGVAVAALVETSWDPENPPDNDAKHLLRRLLSQRGIVSQFLNADPGSSKGPPQKTRSTASRLTDDHRANAAVRDLLRHAGVIDDRLALVTTGPKLVGALDRGAILVGLHLRQHQPRRKGNQRTSTQLVIQLVALHAPGNETDPWYIETYSDHRGAWVPYREGTAAYHAGPIGSTDWTRASEHHQAIRDYVDQALAACPRGRSVIVFVDAPAGRGIWPGLSNARFGKASLPGDGLDHPDLAIVRYSSAGDVPRSTHRTHGGLPNDKNKPPLPRGAVYEHEEAGTRSWILAQPSRTYRSARPGARTGGDHTRWTLPPTKDKHMGNDWHALTAIEIAIPRAGTWDPVTLTALTARLCQQAVSWDDRTSRPSPAHLAYIQDLDHPQRAEDPEGTDE